MEKMYFVDFESYCYEDGKIYGDLGWESDIESTGVESVRLARKFIEIWHLANGCVTCSRRKMLNDGYFMYNLEGAIRNCLIEAKI